VPIKPHKPEPYDGLDINKGEFLFGGFGYPTAGLFNPDHPRKSFGVRG